MPSVDLVEPVHVRTAIHSSCSNDTYTALIFSDEKNLVHIFQNHNIVHTIYPPGYSADYPPPKSLVVCCAWSPLVEEGIHQLIIATSHGHLCACDTRTWTLTNIKYPSRIEKHFQKLIVVRDLIVLSTNKEVVVLQRTTWGDWEMSSIRPAVPLPSRDLILDMDVSGNVVAVCCQQRRSVVVISLNNERPELRAQLRQTPKDASELSDGEFVTPAEGDDDLFILNEIKLSQKRVPVACAWSKYTDVLVLASSDNLLSIWNISSRSIETVAVGDESVVIRNVKFISDVVVAVALNDGIVLVDVDEGVLYEADKHSSGPGSKCASLDCVMLKGGNKVLVARPAHARLDRWKVGL